MLSLLVEEASQLVIQGGGMFDQLVNASQFCPSQTCICALCTTRRLGRLLRLINEAISLLLKYREVRKAISLGNL